jgi:ribosome modulation factor
VTAYDKGVAAARAGMSEDANPYDPGTEDYRSWLAGFADGLDAIASQD